VVLEEIIRSGRPREIAVSAAGVREGLLFVEAGEEGVGPALQVGAVAGAAGAQAVELGGGAEQRCLLADIGWRTHPDYRGEQSLNLIAHGNFVGLDHPGRAYLAVAVFFRHEARRRSRACRGWRRRRRSSPAGRCRGRGSGRAGG
jgi:exopolyphosphatase/guanosine-5'-triphosphate,3'-diphosphate pyrophosphatase